MTMWRIKGSEYNRNVINLTKILSKIYDRIVFVSINRPLPTLLDDLGKAGINKEKFQLVCVASKDGTPHREQKQTQNIENLDVTGLSIKVGDAIGKWKPTALVLDSAVTMGAYMDDRTVIRFIQELILKLQATGCRGVFPVSATEKETPLLGNIEMFMDEVSEMG